MQQTYCAFTPGVCGSETDRNSQPPAPPDATTGIHSRPQFEVGGAGLAPGGAGSMGVITGCVVRRQ